MKLAVMQPTYMPWTGYLRLIARSDTFVYLDDAQYERGTWHQRNRVLVNGEPRWLTVPVRRTHLGDAINQVTVDDSIPWRRKHQALLANAYGRHPHAADALGLSALLERTELVVLADLNIALVEHCCARLGLSTVRRRASTLDVPGTRTQRLVAMCDALGADTYVSPPGARDYLQADGFTSLTGTPLEFDEFIPPTYPQRGTASFVSHLSVLDAVANLGWDGLKRYIAL